MKQIVTIHENLYHVISEPGDATRYDYFVYRDGPDNFCFMPCESTFRFPQRLNYWIIKNVDSDAIISMAHELFCNPYTLNECIRTIIELRTE